MKQRDVQKVRARRVKHDQQGRRSLAAKLQAASAAALNVSHCMFYTTVAVGFNTLCYDAAGEIILRTNKVKIDK